MWSWFKDKDNRTSFALLKNIHFDTSIFNRKKTGSSSSDSTLLYIDKETQILISQSFNKLSVARPLSEQVAMNNSIANYYTCPFQEREYMQFRIEKEPIGKCKLTPISVDIKEPVFKKTVQKLFKTHRVLRKSKSELILAELTPSTFAGLRRRKSDTILEVASKSNQVSLLLLSKSAEC